MPARMETLRLAASQRMFQELVFEKQAREDSERSRIRAARVIIWSD